MSTVMSKVLLYLPLKNSYLAKVYQHLEKSIGKPAMLENKCKNCSENHYF